MIEAEQKTVEWTSPDTISMHTSEEDQQIILRLQRKLGLNRSGILRLAIRYLADREQIAR